MDVIKGFMNSKKFWATVAGLLATVLIELVPGLQQFEDNLIQILGILGIYIFGQGLADLGKNSR